MDGVLLTDIWSLLFPELTIVACGRLSLASQAWRALPWGRLTHIECPFIAGRVESALTTILNTRTRGVQPLEALLSFTLNVNDYTDDRMLCNYLRTATRLVHLDLSHADIQGDCLSSLPCHSTLRTLIISNCKRFANEGIVSLSLMTGLQSLRIEGTGAARFSRLQALTNLTSLSLSGDSKYLDLLTHLNNLESLCIRDCLGSDKSAAGLTSSLTRLTKLVSVNARLNFQQDGTHLKPITCLQSLVLEENYHVNVNVIVDAFPNLTSLRYGRTPLADSAHNSLFRLSRLLSLELVKNTELTTGKEHADDFMHLWKTEWPQLRRLAVSSCLTSQMLYVISCIVQYGHTNLEELVLAGIDLAMPHILAIPDAFPNLRLFQFEPQSHHLYRSSWLQQIQQVQHSIAKRYKMKLYNTRSDKGSHLLTTSAKSSGMSKAEIEKAKRQLMEEQLQERKQQKGNRLNARQDENDSSNAKRNKRGKKK